MVQHVIVVEYNPEWDKMFDIEATKIKSILKQNSTEIFHIGSTAVKGLKAKPIIDIMPIVNSLDEVDKVSKEFEKIGYKYLGEFGIAGRRYLYKGLYNHTHHIHIFQKDDTINISRHLAVRDFLRTHDAKAKQYGDLKERLAAEYPYNIEKYCDGKDEFVKQLEKDAFTWKKIKLF